MGTTLTPNLGLIKPDKDESMANWLEQWAANANIIDARSYVAFGSYTPVWTASTTNPTFGTGGFISGKWFRIGPRLVIAWIKCEVGGAGFDAGSGTYLFTMPFTIASAGTIVTSSNGSSSVGKGWAFAAFSTLARETGVVQLRSRSLGTVFVNTEGASGTAWSSSNPFSWGASDSFSMYATYQTDDAP